MVIGYTGVTIIIIGIRRIPTGIYCKNTSPWVQYRTVVRYSTFLLVVVHSYSR